MTSRALGVVLLLATSVLGCGTEVLSTSSDTPGPLDARAISLGTIRLEWPSVSDQDISGYVIERRTDLTGPFTVLTDEVLQSAGMVVYFDEALDPETFYGYRVRAVTRFGEWSSTSPVAGARTPALPGVEVAAQTTSPNPQSLDGDGYFVSVAGTVSAGGSLGPLESRRFSPLPAGSYQVTLSGIEPNCLVQGDTVRTVTVTDQGVETITPVRYQVACRDPSRGEIAATVSAAGDSLDADGYLLDVQGIAGDATLPDSARVYTRLIRLPSGAGGAHLFDNLRPGSYIVTLLDLAANCSLQGSAARTVSVTALSSDLLAYDVICVGSDPNTGSRPFAWRNIFSPQSATSGQKVTLLVSLDLTASASQDVSAVQAELRYDAAALRLDSISPAQLEQFTPNTGTPGLVNWLAFTTATPPRGVVQLARFNFTTTGSPGATSRTRTTLQIVGAGDGATQIDSMVRVVEDTFSVGSGPVNQAPVAEANGPYSGTAGTTVAFSASGSADPDGSIATYAWSFSDGGSATGVSPTHVFAAAGSYLGTLTVTDNLGATSTDQATVTISGGGGNLPPTAQANGPYAGTVGSPIAFTSAGSSDSDGSISSYAWTFGDGGTATGASPAHAYTTAGVKTVTLTVTDNQGGTGVGQATVTVTDPGSGTPFTWSASFGSINPADSLVALTILYDLAANIVETPGTEALQGWVVDSLKWNPAILRYHSFNFGPGGFGSVNPTFATSQGLLVFSGTQPAGNSTGLIAIATIRFKVIGAAGSTTTTSTFLGNLIGTGATGGFNYRSKTAKQEATLIVP